MRRQAQQTNETFSLNFAIDDQRLVVTGASFVVYHGCRRYAHLWRQPNVIDRAVPAVGAARADRTGRERGARVACDADKDAGFLKMLAQGRQFRGVRFAVEIAGDHGRQSTLPLARESGELLRLMHSLIGRESEVGHDKFDGKVTFTES